MSFANGSRALMQTASGMHPHGFYYFWKRNGKSLDCVSSSQCEDSGSFAENTAVSIIVLLHQFLFTNYINALLSYFYASFFSDFIFYLITQNLEIVLIIFKRDSPIDLRFS